MAERQITAQERVATGKGVARKLRVEGQVPAVVYGTNQPSRGLVVNERDISRLLMNGALGRLVRVNLDGEVVAALLKEAQTDPIRGDLLHVDFQAVDMDQEINTVVAISLTGEEERVVDGGVLAANLWELEITCLPGSIPDVIVVDVSGLSLGDNITVADLDLPEGVTSLTPEDETVVSVVAPAAEEEEEEEDVDVELIGEEEAEEEEEAAPEEE